MVADGSSLVPAAEAAARLGVKRDTLYAYVSRGQIEAHQVPGRRGSFFEPEALDALIARSRWPQTKRPDARMTSAITLIENGRYWYRGHDPFTLARSSSFEQVAELLWVDADPAADPPQWLPDRAAMSAAIAAQVPLGPEPGPLERLSVIVPVLAAHDRLRHDLRPPGAAATARRLLAGAVAALCHRPEASIDGPAAVVGAGRVATAGARSAAPGAAGGAARPGAATPGARGRIGASVGGASGSVASEGFPSRERVSRTGVAALLSAMLAGTGRSRRIQRRYEALLNQALVIMADHELAPSTVAVRIAAGVHSDPYAAMAAGLGTVSGSWHGAAGRRIESLLWSVSAGANAEAELARLLHGGPPVAGFGQVLYPDGDPRAPVLLDLAAGVGPVPEVDAVLAVAATQGLPPPNVDFALGALTHRMGLSVGASETIFAVGRLAGWLAHAIEEYAHGSDLRLRAIYVGRRPAPEG